MEDVISLVQSELAANNNDILYSDFIEKVPYPQRPYVPEAMREMKRRGIATRRNVFDRANGTNALHIVKL